jgi:hypothetical protein
MDTAKETYRDIEQDTKKVVRDADGHDLGDDLGNAGDEVRKDLGNAGDRARREISDVDRDVRDRNERDRSGRPIDDPMSPLDR